MCSHLLAAFAARRRRSIADLRRPQGARWSARHARRPGHHGSSRASLRLSRTLLPEAPPGAIRPQDRGYLTIGDSSHDAGPVAGVGAMNTPGIYKLNEVNK